MDVVLLFPGQGSQKPGMARDLADAYPASRAALDAVDAALGAPISPVMFDGPAETLTETHNAQPALLAHAAAAWAAVRDRVGPMVRAAAGHSLGEFSAYMAAGTLALDDAARLVRRRGELMLEAGSDAPGAMAAIVGDTSRSVDDLCEDAADAGTVVPANYNSPGQTVVSGEVAAVERVMALARTAGAKLVTRLNVSGAFHSPLMAPAAASLAEALDTTEFADPRFPVFANVDASPVTGGDRARALLLRQLTSPVRWTEVMRALAAAHPSALYVEMGPGTVLKGLAKKIAPELRVVSCGSAADVAALLDLVA